jgi:catechol 2,3-dioxygenase-like lactoylglutathione lyase family enzyme
MSLFEECAFITLTTADLGRARDFWVVKLGFPVIHEDEHYFIIDAGGTRLCFDLPDGAARQSGSHPSIGLKVKRLEDAMTALEQRGVQISARFLEDSRGRWAELHDPDGRTVILTERAP